MWRSLNVDLNPLEKELLLTGELTRFVCDNCGNSSEIAYPMLYHDMSRKLMIYMVYDSDTREIEELAMGKYMEGYSFRRVGSRNDLMEKIRIFEAGFDDRLVELFKLVLSRELDAPDGAPLYFSGIEKNRDGRDCLFFVHFPSGKFESFGVELASLTDFTRQIDGLIDDEPGDEEAWPEISSSYAHDVWQRYTSGEG